MRIGLVLVMLVGGAGVCAGGCGARTGLHGLDAGLGEPDVRPPVPRDGGTRDAATRDAGTRDAGARDAGPLLDAGVPPAGALCLNVLVTDLPGVEEARVAEGLYEHACCGGEDCFPNQMVVRSAPTTAGRFEMRGRPGESWTIELFAPDAPMPFASGTSISVATVSSAFNRFYVDAVFDVGGTLRRVTGSFEYRVGSGGVACPGCDARACLRGERVWNGDACCCGLDSQPPAPPSPEPGFCTPDESPSVLPTSTTADVGLRACGGCGAGQICAGEPFDGTTRLCRPACTSNADCALYEVCREGVCRPARCRDDGDCGPDRRCYAPAPGASAAYCSGQNFDGRDPCIPLASHTGGTIEGAFCALRCTGDRACPAGWICERRDPASPFGWCAPHCVARACAQVRTDFDETLAAARRCTRDTDCHIGGGGCGLWERHWEHCSGVVTLGSDTAASMRLSVLERESQDRCVLPPCATCDADPECRPACVGGTCVGNCR